MNRVNLLAINGLFHKIYKNQTTPFHMTLVLKKNNVVQEEDKRCSTQMMHKTHDCDTKLTPVRR